MHFFEHIHLYSLEPALDTYAFTRQFKSHIARVVKRVPWPMERGLWFIEHGLCFVEQSSRCVGRILMNEHPIQLN